MHFASYGSESPLTMVSMSPFIPPVVISSELGKLGHAICGGIFAMFACVILRQAKTTPFASYFYELGCLSGSNCGPGLFRPPGNSGGSEVLLTWNSIAVDEQNNQFGFSKLPGC